jgi:hypothetical protein
MVTFKRFACILLAVLIVVPAVMGQAKSGNDELSVEESYLQQALEMMIIRETSRAGDREQKWVALEYIGSAIDRGNADDSIRETLEYLALEGTTNKSNENGRITNNFPDVRREAARYLGRIATPESKRTLIKIISSDPETMVLQEAVKSLGDIGLNENNDAVDAIVFIANKINNTLPDNLLALSAIDAIEKLSPKEGAPPKGVLELLTKIGSGPYNSAVKTKAKLVLRNLYSKRS